MYLTLGVQLSVSVTSGLLSPVTWMMRKGPCIVNDEPQHLLSRKSRWIPAQIRVESVKLDIWSQDNRKQAFKIKTECVIH